ncbi:MAG TPA: hypothetical protein PLB09_09025 [Deltaproteobacteria bacterium]|nr:hypothetical protein [Deltaproteobacteria bacterium]
MSDSVLSDVTGQAGVNINPDLTMNIEIGTMAWGDADGLSNDFDGAWGTTGYTAGGYVGVKNFNITNLQIRLRGTEDGYNGYSTTMLKPITIDVATGAKEFGQGANTTFVRFGIGALAISMDAMNLTVALGTDPGTAGSFDQELGSAHIGALAMYMNPYSYVDIYSHGGQGVTFDLSITIDHLELSYMSWGDSDGLAGVPSGIWIEDTTPDAGYVGIQDLVINAPIIITGTVAIDVVTSSAGAYLAASMGNIDGSPSVTIVHISFPGTAGTAGLEININGSITGNVRLGTDYDLSTGTYGELGNFYLGHLDVQIMSGSWVDIWAH